MTRAYHYIWLGGSFRFLLHVQAGWRPHLENGILSSYENMGEALDSLKLPVTRNAVEAELAPIMLRWQGLPTDYELTAEEAKDLTQVMAQLRVVLDAESRLTMLFSPSPKRYETARLLGDVPSLFGAGTWAKLPATASHDLAEAGKCIAFELPTAAAFLLLRGTEAVLREYYLQRVKRGRITDLMWGPIVGALKLARRNAVAPVLLANLDNIRSSYRNPTAHPEKIYDLDEAQDLFGLCIEVINRMAKELA